MSGVKIVKKGPVGQDLTTWVDVPTDDVYSALQMHFNKLLQSNAVQQVNNRAMRFYYLDMNTSLFSNSSLSSAWREIQGTVTTNVIGSAINSVASQVLKDPPRIRIVTENGNGKLQRQAKKLTQFADGLLEEGGLRVEEPRACVDALVCGTGYVYVYSDLQGNPCVEHVWPNDILVDLVDGEHMKPTEMFRRGRSSRATLIKQFPKLEKEINAAAPLIGSFQGSSAVTTVPNVGLGEAWHLPSPGEDNGRHVIFCSTCTLLDEPWDLDFIPIFPVRWQEDQIGFHGIGITWQLQATQQNINEFVEYWIQTCRMNAMPRWSVEESAMPPEGQFAQPGGILTRPDGSNPPTPLPITLLPMDFTQYIESRVQWAYQLVGLNDGAVKATSNVGPNASGAAQREERDTQSQRLGLFMERRDRLNCDIVKAAIELTRKWTKDNGAFTKQVRGKQFLGTIKWADCSIEQNAYSVEAFATSMLPLTPAGRMQTVSEMMQLGSIDRETGISLLDMPDADAETQRLTSDLIRLDKMIDDILDDQTYPIVDEFLMMSNPQLLLSTVVQAINLAYVNDEKPEAIDMLGRLFSDMVDKVKLANDAKQKMLPPPPPPGPTAVGAPPPMNPSLPQQMPAQGP